MRIEFRKKIVSKNADDVRKYLCRCSQSRRETTTCAITEGVTKRTAIGYTDGLGLSPLALKYQPGR